MSSTIAKTNISKYIKNKNIKKSSSVDRGKYLSLKAMYPLPGAFWLPSAPSKNPTFAGFFLFFFYILKWPVSHVFI